ncbi:CUAEP/CCAEP-tail radical SAM protein, partial [Micromonospora sp. NPDC051296]
AVESFDDTVLEVFDKRHTTKDLVVALRTLSEVGIAVNPTFVAFTPWTSRASYADFLAAICDLGLVESVAAVQYAIRLLVPAGSRLLDRTDMQEHLGTFDPEGLCHRWTHPDPLMDELQSVVFAVAEDAARVGWSRVEVFDRVRQHAAQLLGGPEAERLAALQPTTSTSLAAPYLTEPWFCCAEPVRSQLEPLL